MPTYNNETFYPIRHNGIGFRSADEYRQYQANPNAWVSSFSDPTSAFETLQLGQEYKYHDPHGTYYEDVEVYNVFLEELHPQQIPDFIPVPREQIFSTNWFNFLQKEYHYPQWADMQIKEVKEIVNPVFNVWR